MNLETLDRLADLIDAGKVTHIEMPGHGLTAATTGDDIRAMRDICAKMLDSFKELGEMAGASAADIAAFDSIPMPRLRAWRATEVPLGPEDDEPNTACGGPCCVGAGDPLVDTGQPVAAWPAAEEAIAA